MTPVLMLILRFAHFIKHCIQNKMISRALIPQIQVGKAVALPPKQSSAKPMLLLTLDSRLANY
jgi:hypothetical protein